MTKEYFNLLAASKVIDLARYEVYCIEGTSPAWRMLLHAGTHLQKQAEIALRGEATCMMVAAFELTTNPPKSRIGAAE